MSIEAGNPDDDLVADVEDRSRRQRRHARRTLSVRLRALSRSMANRFSSSLTRRIIVLNLGGLVILLIGFLYLNQFRQGLIDARVQSLQTQGEIIAGAIAASAKLESDSIVIDPDRLMQMAPGEELKADSSTQFSLIPERVAPLLRRVLPSGTRARVYDADGTLVLDSIMLHGSVLSADLPPPVQTSPSLPRRLWTAVMRRLFGAEATPADEPVSTTSSLPEVVAALKGYQQTMVRLNPRGETIVYVAIPVQRYHHVRGVLLMQTQGGDIDRAIAAERWSILRVYLFCTVVMFLVSLFLAGTIAGPMRKLAEAAERVRRGIKSRQEIPDFTDRADEIGHLSGALRDMTKALYNRIEAIESFAADVSHELKNPLTSLRSAVEILPRVRTDEARERLLGVIQHDVRRLDRLISDISDASRLDAELARADNIPIDVKAMLDAVVVLANELRHDDKVRVRLKVLAPDCEEGEDPALAYLISGNESRLGQVINNLVDNARSFSAPGGEVRVTLLTAFDPEHERRGIEIEVEDDGPGIPAHAFERIFERFYTDRPGQGFGQNSGLGLSISRQIVEAHKGLIWATNRTGVRKAPLKPGIEEAAGPNIVGARFTVWLPRP
ncbi:sensor histidine kinase [Methylovirgula sp. 4M-Z18]|uniref:sensor histidine kinase n=1 Tax=Methylovirgula sp. 4M-Z18 TaxID=2293567 RepID=UPI000E2F7FC3|nr:sensor histidine kinase [Methylovirgula sp. 4M-Z18]RFB79719.1 HAMP domain-containing protein [Methylovirgula sp. 4M-Z18]